MQFVLLYFDDPATVPAPGSAEDLAEFETWMVLAQEMAEVGVGVAGAPLEPSSAAVTVRVRGGERLVTDGPFAETKEQLGGYDLIEVPDLAAAVEWARRMPNVGRGSVEIRPVVVLPAPDGTPA